ncbi:uncharacterized protein LOC129639380 isoform X6 [Bubalus kerabau]|uniref:uncharacterized protein LOC129639380 isoform X6 n=1 Tax=Bubalus carabanensis TaxID=3119969 RepID=UPI00244EEDE0|nr:uncharacterized protein LOC129639380 isoform X6 [Bubalus carabanensis]
MPSTGTLGGTLPSGPKSLKVKRQACPHDGSRGLKRPAPAARLSQITIMGLDQGCNWMWQGSLPFHSCLETFDHWTEPREGLSEDSLTNPEEIRYTDGSSFVLDGKRRAGSTSYNMQCQFNKDIKLQLTMENITHPWTPL